MSQYLAHPVASVHMTTLAIHRMTTSPVMLHRSPAYHLTTLAIHRILLCPYSPIGYSLATVHAHLFAIHHYTVLAIHRTTATYASDCLLHLLAHT